MEAEAREEDLFPVYLVRTCVVSFFNFFPLSLCLWEFPLPPLPNSPSMRTDISMFFPTTARKFTVHVQQKSIGKSLGSNSDRFNRLFSGSEFYSCYLFPTLFCLAVSSFPKNLQKCVKKIMPTKKIMRSAWIGRGRKKIKVSNSVVIDVGKKWRLLCFSFLPLFPFPLPPPPHSILAGLMLLKVTVFFKEHFHFSQDVKRGEGWGSNEVGSWVLIYFLLNNTQIIRQKKLFLFFFCVLVHF